MALPLPSAELFRLMNMTWCHLPSVALIGVVVPAMVNVCRLAVVLSPYPKLRIPPLELDAVSMYRENPRRKTLPPGAHRLAVPQIDALPLASALQSFGDVAVACPRIQADTENVLQALPPPLLSPITVEVEAECEVLGTSTPPATVAEVPRANSQAVPAAVSDRPEGAT
jgi:hypothetical protein